MKKVLLLLPVFLLIIGAVRAVESPKHEIRAVWLTTVYGLDWPKRPATTEAGQESPATGTMYYPGPARRREFQCCLFAGPPAGGRHLPFGY